MPSTNLFLLMIILSLTCSRQSPAQTPSPRLIQYEEARERTLIPITDSLQIPAIAPGYTLLLPADRVRAVIVMFQAGRDTSHVGFEQRLYVDAARRQVATLYVTTDNPVEFLFDSTRLEQLDRYIGEAVRQYALPADRLLFAGMSLGGTRALKLAQWCLAGRSRHGLRPRAVAVCDAPLDFHRFWRAAARVRAVNVNEIAVNEAVWTMSQLELNLGGTPLEAPEAYSTYSPYVYEIDIDPKLAGLKQVAVRAYTEADMDWWMENRHKDYYGINSPDAAGLINDLQILGNREAALILTTGKGYRPDGSRHPHSWSIVDNGELVEWLLGLP